MVHATSPGQAERDLVDALREHLRRIQDREATRIDWDDFPTVRITRLYLSPRPGKSFGDVVARSRPGASRSEGGV